MEIRSAVGWEALALYGLYHQDIINISTTTMTYDYINTSIWLRLQPLDQYRNL